MLALAATAAAAWRASWAPAWLADGLHALHAPAEQEMSHVAAYQTIS